MSHLQFSKSPAVEAAVRAPLDQPCLAHASGSDMRLSRRLLPVSWLFRAPVLRAGTTPVPRKPGRSLLRKWGLRAGPAWPEEQRLTRGLCAMFARMPCSLRHASATAAIAAPSVSLFPFPRSSSASAHVTLAASLRLTVRACSRRRAWGGTHEKTYAASFKLLHIELGGLRRTRGHGHRHRASSGTPQLRKPAGTLAIAPTVGNCSHGRPMLDPGSYRESEGPGGGRTCVRGASARPGGRWRPRARAATWRRAPHVAQRPLDARRHFLLRKIK